MKLEALDHPKTMDLASRLNVVLPTAIGHLELLWAFTGKKAPQGNIGKWPNGAISMACFWSDNADQFVQALVAARFLDPDPEHRLLIHDWHDHAPNWVRAKLKKANLTFLSTPLDSVSVSAGVSGGVSAGVGACTASDAPTDTRSSRARVLPSEAKRSVLTDSGDFETRLRNLYPPFTGRQNWITALHTCGKLVDDAIATWERLLEGTERYRAYCTAHGMEWYTPLNPVRFFGDPDHPWAQSWELKAPAAQTREQSELKLLAARRQAIGLADFRDPEAGETSDHYRAAQDEAWNRLQRRAGVPVAHEVSRGRQAGPTSKHARSVPPSPEEIARRRQDAAAIVERETGAAAS